MQAKPICFFGRDRARDPDLENSTGRDRNTNCIVLYQEIIKFTYPTIININYTMSRWNLEKLKLKRNITLQGFVEIINCLVSVLSLPKKLNPAHPACTWKTLIRKSLCTV